MMSKFDEAAASLEVPIDFAGAYVDDRPREVMIVQSVRLPRGLTERLFVEAERRGVTPSEVIRDLIARGLEAADRSATVRLEDVHRAIDALARRAA
jgi:predicted DNA-binding protein